MILLDVFPGYVSYKFQKVNIVKTNPKKKFFWINKFKITILTGNLHFMHVYNIINFKNVIFLHIFFFLKTFSFRLTCMERTDSRSDRRRFLP